MSIEMYRYTGKSVTPLVDALLFEKSAPVNGINNGCVLSHLGSNQVAITAGYGRINGRDFKVTAETLLVQLASSGTMPGRIYVKINLADSVNTIQLLSVCASSLPALVQDADFNLTNGIWEMELATYSATTTAISGLATTYATVKKSLTENNIVNTNTATEEGMVADARQLNPEIADTLAYQVKLQQVRSTSERIVGKDIDGKTMYEKTYSLVPTALGYTSVASGISNIFKMWINPEMSYVVYGGTYRTPTWISASLAEGNALSCCGGNIGLFLGNGLVLASVTNAQATVRYTKTV